MNTNNNISYKNIQTLSNFLTLDGKIISRHETGISMRNQRKIARAIKQARNCKLIKSSYTFDTLDTSK